MFKDLPLTVRNVQATEARLNRIYDAAKLGLTGNSLALAAGMRPDEYRQLCELDPLALMAAEKGKADGELELSRVMYTAAANGDSKAALEVLKHKHEWVAKQQVQVDVNQSISVLGALREAEARLVLDAELADAVEVPTLRDATPVQPIGHQQNANTNLLTAGRADANGASVGTED